MKTDVINIRETITNDLDNILQVEKLAFGQDEEANLVADLLNDATAKPILSLLAFYGSIAAGHILFTRAYFRDAEKQPLMHILAPLAVIPDYQGMGIGGALITQGLAILRLMGSELVFVLGHEKYYAKYGFVPNAEKSGFKPPYPIASEHKNAWMFQLLDKERQFSPRGRIQCANELDKPNLWKA